MPTGNTCVTRLRAFVLAFSVLTIMSTAGFAQSGDNSLKPRVSTAAKSDLSPPLRSMRALPLEEERTGVQPDDPRRRIPPSINRGYDPDPLVQRFKGDGIFSGSSEMIPPTTRSFVGMTSTSQPPDPVGDVGPQHYVQMVNSRFQVFNKNTGVSIFGPVNINTLWAGFGGACQTQNAGDPVVIHDQFADRWLLMQFTSTGTPWFNCVAISQTSDPAGAYYRYAFSTGNSFPDYPKLSLWHNAYYITTREFVGGSGGPFGGIGVYAINRDQMLVGNATPQVVSFILPPSPNRYWSGDGLLPADIDGRTLPPAGSPQYLVGSMDAGGPYGAPADALNLFKMNVDWAAPASSTLAFDTQINIAPYDTIFPCVTTSRNCIPQPVSATTQRLDILSYRQRPTFRLAYRNFGTYESLVTTQSVEATAGVAGMRWWEIRSPNASPVLFQEGTYSPDSVNRWMGSIAQDKDGNMLLGYNVSDAATVFPGIRYTGRLAADPVGTMPQGEGTMMDGTGAHTNTNHRWGDYTHMAVDPVDDCTFWYTAQYIATTSSSTSIIRWSSVKFPQCAPALAVGVTVSGRVLNAGGRGIRGAIVKITSMATGWNRVATTGPNGVYQFNEVPAGDTYLVTVQARRYSFAEPTRVLNLQDDVSGFNFVSN